MWLRNELENFTVGSRRYMPQCPITAGDASGYKTCFIRSREWRSNNDKVRDNEVGFALSRIVPASHQRFNVYRFYIPLSIRSCIPSTQIEYNCWTDNFLLEGLLHYVPSYILRLLNFQEDCSRVCCRQNSTDFDLH